VAITNSRIANSEWANQGEGARFQYRYVNRQLTNEPLLPWPMEDRIKAELGVSVNNIVTTMVNQSGGQFPPVPNATATPAASPTPGVAATPVATPVAPPVGGYRINVPLYAVNAGDTQLDANNWSVVSFGKVSSDNNNYGDLRLVGRNDGLMVRAQLFDNRAIDGDAVTVEIKGVTKRVVYSTTVKTIDGWEIGDRCEAGACRGWSATAFFPWSDFGGKPADGAVWSLRAVFNDKDLSGATSTSAWPPTGTGSLRWGLPDYAGRPAGNARMVQLAFSGDSMLGGGTDCAPTDWPDFFPSWGNHNYSTSPYVNVQMQWDIADWPCYAKYYAAWSLSELPAGAQVISATVEMRQFGNPGYGTGYEDNATKDTVMQVSEVKDRWDEATITWDNAPVPVENTARTVIKPLPGDCQPTPHWYCSPGIPYTFDITEIVKRAQTGGRSWASLALYTAAGQYHSGKYFSSREGAEPPVVRIAYTLGTATPQPLPDAETLLFMPAIKGGKN
jgi:hypothetical protein